MNAFFTWGQAILMFVFWLIVAAGATWAVFSPTVRDTALERLALACVALSATGAACRAIFANPLPNGALFVGGSLAFYIVAIIIKKMHRRHHPIPKDKTRPGELA